MNIIYLSDTSFNENFYIRNSEVYPFKYFRKLRNQDKFPEILQPKLVSNICFYCYKNRNQLVHDEIDIVHDEIDIVHDEIDIVHDEIDLVHNEIDLVHNKFDLVHNENLILAISGFLNHFEVTEMYKIIIK